MVCRALAVMLLLAAGTAQAAMYRWVDANGKVHYTDTPPTTYQKSGGAELNKQGTVVRRTQSEAERRAEAMRRDEQKQLQLEQQKQAQTDRALTQTYTTVAEIDLARDRALEHHGLAIKSAEIRGVAVEKNLADLRSRIAYIEKSGRKANPGLVEQLAHANRESLDLKRIILSNMESMEAVRMKYAADKARFIELTGKEQ